MNDLESLVKKRDLDLERFESLVKKRPICARCNKPMICKKNDVLLRFGNKKRDFVYYHADIYECKDCKALIYQRFGMPFLESREKEAIKAIKIIW